MIAGIAPTQEMLDLCAEHGIGAEVEVISADRIDEAYERVDSRLAPARPESAGRCGFPAGAADRTRRTSGRAGGAVGRVRVGDPGAARPRGTQDGCRTRKPPAGRDFRRLLSDRLFLGAVLITGFVNAALFAYLSGATYVLQGVYGLSPQGYSFAFGLNSAGFMVFGFVAGRLSERWSEKGTLVLGLAMTLLGAAGLLVAAALHLPLAAMVLSLLTMVSGVAATTPPSTSLALAHYPGIAGTASSLLGMARFAFGGLAAPLVGLGGAGTALPLGLVTLACAALAVIVHALAVRPHTRTARHTVAAGRPVDRVTATS